MKEPAQAALFLYRRFCRIFTNYWPVMIAMIAITWLFRPAALLNFDYLSGIFLVHVRAAERILPVSWTLSRELLFYILFAIACLAPRRFLPWLVGTFVLAILIDQFLPPGP
jgi:peptidoglycan/LPS O-acetylase OafA/YrhL